MKIELNSKSVDFPFSFELSENPDEEFEKLLSTWNHTAQERRRILFVCGSGGMTETFLRKYKERMEVYTKNDAGTYKVIDGSINDVRIIDTLCATQRVDLIVALGGGKVIDVVKSVVRLRLIALIIIPTVLSSDCISSPVAVLKNDLGVTESFPSGIPSCVFIDLTITVKAPEHLTISGLGDVLSNASALQDVKLHEANTGLPVNGFAKIMSESAYQLIIGFGSDYSNDARTHRGIATSLILSGLAMGLAGNSLPCSGAEHLISHALDKSARTKSLHGIQVALGTRYCAALREILDLPRIDPRVIECMDMLPMPRSPDQIDISRADFISAVREAPKTRPTRINLLSMNVSDSDINKAYERAFGNG